MAYRVGWFSTGRDEAARILLRSVHEKRSKLGIDIAYVFCNRERGESPQSDLFLDDMGKFGINCVRFSSAEFRSKYQDWRDGYHEEVMKRLERYRMPEPGIDVLAGYMLFASSCMAKEYRLLNLHPALPWGPKGTWQQVIWKLMEADETETGVMLHRATEDWDRGPAVTFCKFPIAGGEFDEYWKDYRAQRKELALDRIKEKYPDAGYPQTSHVLFTAIREAGFRREIPSLCHTLGEFSKGNVEFDGDSVVSHGEVLEHGHDITELVEREIMP